MRRTGNFTEALGLAFKGHKQTEVAQAAGVSQSSLSAYLAGRTEPPVETARKLERALRLHPGQLTRHLGYVPIVDDEEAAPGRISFEEFLMDEADRLTPEQRTALLTVYRSYVAASDLDPECKADELAADVDAALTDALRQRDGEPATGGRRRRGSRSA